MALLSTYQIQAMQFVQCVTELELMKIGTNLLSFTVTVRYQASHYELPASNICDTAHFFCTTGLRSWQANRSAFQGIHFLNIGYFPGSAVCRA